MTIPAPSRQPAISIAPRPGFRSSTRRRRQFFLKTVSLSWLGAEVDECDIPFRIRSGYFYEVRGPLKHGAGKPHILALKDFNRDRKALEFALYVMESCNGPMTMVLG